MKILKLLPIIGISILIYIIYKIGLTNLYQTLITANLFYVFLALVFIAIGALSLTFKWYAILRLQDININFLYAFKLYLIGLFYGLITPAKTGSIIRASYLKDKTGKSFGSCASSIIMERLMDLFVLFTFSTIGCIVFSKYIYNWLPVILIFFGLFILLSLFLLKESVNRLFFTFVYNFLIPVKLKEKSKEIYGAFYSNLLSFKKLIYPFFLTVITWILIGAQTFFIAKAFDVNISFFYMVLIVSIGTVVGLIPITVGGLGTREATLIFLFSFFNVPAVKVVSISLLALLFGCMLVSLTGFFVSLREPQPGGLI